ncbi:MAG: serine hydrolase [Thermoanaerobaculia bacterium]|nr:serine hydrolase [Thermoanaerobaculia bacterium]
MKASQARCPWTTAVVLSLVLCTAPVGAETAATAALSNESGETSLAEQLDELFAAAYPADEPGAAVLVRRGDEILLQEGYGMADMELDVGIEPHMIFRIGSITKQFTAVAVLMLVEDGKLALDQTIRQVLPDYPQVHGDEVTVEQLLTHVSGIPSYTDQPTFWEVANDDASLEERVEFFSSEELEFEPGSQWKYNNSAYLLLGAILEKVAGTTYSDFLQQRIFDPLQMSSSSYGDPERIVKGRVEGYQPQGEARFRIADYISMDWPYSAGSLLSSVADLDRWDQALYGDKLLPRTTLEKAWTSAKLNDGSATGYGYGWAVGQVAGHRLIQHGGGIHGFRTQAIRIPDEKIFVAVFTNGARTSPTSMARRAVQLLLGEPLPDVDDVVYQVAAETLESYVGVYRIDEETTRIVKLIDGALTTQRTGGGVSTPIPLSDTRFFYDDSLTTLDFVVENAEVVAQVMTPWGDEPERAERTDDPIPEGPQRADVDPALYERVAGVYELRPGFTLTAFRDGDRFMVQGTGQPPVESIPSSPTEFFNETLGARIVFEMDESGERAVALTLHQGGRQLRGERTDG